MDIMPVAAAPRSTVADPRGAKPAAQVSRADDLTAKMWRVAEGFEAMFLDLMMSTMRKTVDESSIFGNSNAMQIYRGMQDQYLAETISKGRQFGLSRLIFDWMCRTRPDIAPAVGRGLDAQKAYLDAARLSVQTGLETIADPAGE